LPDLTGIAIDLGGSHAACAIVRGNAILACVSLPADRASGLAPKLPAIKQAIFELIKIAQIDRADCAGVALGFCGIVNPRDKRVLATNDKFDDATRLDLTAWFEDAFGLPFLLENDARLALLGEHRFGAAHGARDAVMITLGTGIGGAALLDGRLLQSQHGLAGAIGGHFPVVLNGRLCSCGNRGCADAEASTVSLSGVYRELAGGAGGSLTGKRFGFAELFEAIEEGDKPAIATLEHCLQVWSALTVALIHAYDPEVVVYGGSVLKRADRILPRLQEYIDVHAWTSGRKVPLRCATLGPDAALLGAIPLMEYSL
jgi:glucokinase